MDICMKKFYQEKIIFDKMTAVRTNTFFHAYFQNWLMVVYTWTNQLLLQLLMECFYTLTPQYRHIGHLHEEILC